MTTIRAAAGATPPGEILRLNATRKRALRVPGFRVGASGFSGSGSLSFAGVGALGNYREVFATSVFIPLLLRRFGLESPPQEQTFSGVLHRVGDFGLRAPRFKSTFHPPLFWPEPKGQPDAKQLHAAGHLLVMFFFYYGVWAVGCV